MSVANICRRNVVCVQPDMSVREAAALMRAEHVGTLIVTEKDGGHGRPLGILTDRDIVVEVVAAEIDPDAVRVGEAMSGDPLTVTEQDDVLQVVGLMRARRVRRVPVLDAGGAVVGVLSIDDLLDALSEALSDLAWLAQSERERERIRRA